MDSRIVGYRKLALAIVKKAARDWQNGDEQAAGFFDTQLYEAIATAIELPYGDVAARLIREKIEEGNRVKS